MSPAARAAQHRIPTNQRHVRHLLACLLLRVSPALLGAEASLRSCPTAQHAESIVAALTRSDSSCLAWRGFRGFCPAGLEGALSVVASRISDAFVSSRDAGRGSALGKVPGLCSVGTSSSSLV